MPLPTPITSSVTRRSFLLAGTAAVGSLAAGGLLSGCNSGSGRDGAETNSALLLIAPGDVPPEWDRVLAEVNKKLQADTGLTLDVQWIGWSNYLQAELLKWTAGERFTGALEASWAHMPKLAADGALINLDETWAKAESDHPELAKTIHARTIETSRMNGTLWGIPQVSNATSLLGFMTRKDLADGEVSSYADFERYLYGVKQKKSSVVPYGMDNGYVNSALVLFDEAGWEPSPEYMPVPVSNTPLLWIKAADAQAGTGHVVPIWEVPSQVDTMRRVRRYFDDGILNRDLLNVDKKTIYSLFGQGKFAAAIGVTDGQMTSIYGATTKKIPGAELELVLPYADSSAKVFSTFGASNHVVFNKRGDQLVPGMKLMEWLSQQANHDMLQYGVEGTDWTADGDKSYTTKSDYVFPGYTMSWRIPLERRPATMIDSEKRWLDFVQSFDNFDLSPLAGFTVDEAPIKTQLAQFSAGTPKYLRPLQAGNVDTDSGLEALKKGYGNAGLDKVVTEVEKQLSAFFASR